MTTRIVPRAAGRRSALALEPGQVPELAFDHSDGTFSRDGDALSITFGDGSGVFIESFFAGDEQGNLPALRLADGSLVDGKDFLQAMAPGMDLSTAFGPVGASITSSGAGHYSDDAGGLLDGVDRLGALDSGAEAGPAPAGLPDAAAMVPGYAAAPSGDAGLSLAAGDGSGAAPSPSGPSGPVGYSARAVLYPGGEDAVNEVSAAYLDAQGNPDASGVAPDLAWLAGDGDGTGTPLVTASYADGKIVFSLTGAGLAFLADEANGGLEYIEAVFRVTDPVTGRSYNVQVLVPRDADFDSSSLNGQGTGHTLAVSEADLIHGEWHQGNADYGVYRLVSSNLDDELLFTGDMTGSDIRTGYGPSPDWGDDAVTVRGAMRADADGGNTILTGNGADSVAVGGMHAKAGGRNDIDTGGGDGDSVSVSGGALGAGEEAGLYASGKDSVNAVTTGGGAVVAVSGGGATANGIYSHAKGVNEIHADGISVEAASDTRANGVNSWAGTTRLVLDDPSGTVSVSASSRSGTAFGSWVREKGALEVEGGYATSADTENGAAHALVGGKGTNAVHIDGTLTASAHSVSQGSRAVGIDVNSGGTLVIDADATTVSAGSENGLVYGIYGDNGTLDTTGGGRLSIDIESGNNARGIYAKNGGLTLDAGEVALSVASGSNAWGLYANDSGLAVNADSLDVSVTGLSEQSVYGMVAHGENAASSVTAGSVSLTVTGKGGANGMDAYAGNADPGSGDSVGNTITAGRVDITVTGEGSRTVAGMYAHSDGDFVNAVPVVNTIRAGESDSLIVTITASNLGTDNAYAMRTTGGNTGNEILGGRGGDLVDLTGMVWGNNLIDTGGGDDVIRLNGKVQGLTLQAGDGHDTLILQADNAAQFNDFYKKWLGDMDLDAWHAMGIESIHVSTPGGNGQGLDDLQWLYDKVNAYNDAYGPNGSLSRGDGIDLFHTAVADMDGALAGFGADTGLSGLGDLLVDSHGGLEAVAAHHAPAPADPFAAAFFDFQPSGHDGDMAALHQILQTTS